MCVCVFARALISPPRAEQLWWAGQCTPTLGSGEEQGGELQGSSGLWGRPQRPQHEPPVPSAPGCQPWTQQSGGGEEAESAQLKQQFTVYEVRLPQCFCVFSLITSLLQMHLNYLGTNGTPYTGQYYEINKHNTFTQLNAWYMGICFFLVIIC